MIKAELFSTAIKILILGMHRGSSLHASNFTNKILGAYSLFVDKKIGLEFCGSHFGTWVPKFYLICTLDTYGFS